MEYAFNANEVTDDGGGNFDPLPAGEYVVIATESELKDTKAGNGKYLAFTLEVTEGQHQGRLLWLNLNVENPNQQAVDIAMRDYKRLHEAIGIVSSTRTEDLHGKPFVVRLGIDKKDPSRNEIKGFKPHGQKTVTTSFVAPQAPAPQASVPETSGNLPPWKR